jgi:hypothetical protein
MRSVLLVIVATACAPSPQGPVHAPGAPPEASPVSMSTGGSAPAPRSGWYCYEKRVLDLKMTWCERTLDACKAAAGTEMGSAEPGSAWSSCDAADRAYCYSFHAQVDEHEVEACYTTAAECADVNEIAIKMSSRKGDLYPVPGSVTACVENP